MVLVMSALTGCNTFGHKKSFCFLYSPVTLNQETKEFIVDTNDPGEQALGDNKELYEAKCK